MNIAIIGAGISGLAAAHLLHPHHRITLYEKEPRLGGHTRTVEVNTPEGVAPVDTGFIVFNFRNYPLLTRLFRHLQLPLAKSDMSFGARIGADRLEYGVANLRAMFAQRRNLLRPTFWGMLADILRFRRSAAQQSQDAAGLSLGEYLRRLKCGAWFQNHFLLAMGASIWSAPLRNMRDFPAETFVRFFENHGILKRPSQRPQWHTVRGGSREYVRRITEPFRERIRTGCAVRRILRHAESVEVQDSQGQSVHFDHAVMACHTDQALALLADPDDDEREILGAFPWQSNRMVLHSDISFLPHRRAAWSSWVYLREPDAMGESNAVGAPNAANKPDAADQPNTAREPNTASGQGAANKPDAAVASSATGESNTAARAGVGRGQGADVAGDIKDAGGAAGVSLSYWMNNLQPLPTSTPLIVTLNPAREPDPALVHDRWTFSHPLFDRGALQAQARMPQLQGRRRIWYCGAWLGYGFHEDGLRSAVELAERFSVRPPWD